ncbi:hypothetical protein J2S40_001712 [Nocardioides luteus]|uniref:hypothetical protein n=1 Tax=Nocardioides luteus TaxID=1844 RepID=UPI00166CB400|nr:hypothetical protein [Nocardioides luteus]MDR7310654.1 hypothetical protein [Nocardioides luteus]
MPDRPEIVCICGSTRFAEEMNAANRDLTFSGVIVLAPGVFLSTAEREAGRAIPPEQKAALDALHLRKIDLADRVLVVNPGGYIGESTSREIAYARESGKPVDFTYDGPGER